MTEQERSKMIDQIGNYILTRQFAKHETSVSEALAVMAETTIRIIHSLCDVIDEDPDNMLNTYCNALQTGTAEGDELMQKIVDEIREGKPIEEVVDRYVNCATPEMRQKVIDGIRENIERIKKTMLGHGKKKPADTGLF